MMKQKHFLVYLRPLISAVWGLLMIYLVYFIARIVFLLENAHLYPNMTGAHIWELFKGGVLFDTSAILYTNAIWVVMVLFPLHCKEHARWYRVCHIFFVALNTLFFALNLSDTVYFRYTVRRTTTTIFQEFSNEDNLSYILWTEAVNHWYLFLLAIIVSIFLWKAYMLPFASTRKKTRGQLHTYYLAMVLSLVLFTPFCVAGMRGGWTRDIRPITISNATAYCDRPTEAGIVLNTTFSLLRTIGKNNFEVIPYYTSREELEKVFTPIHQSQRVKMQRRKNVVVLIVESFGREYIGAYNHHIAGYKGFTPFVDSLITNGALTYRYSYCNGRKSIDGMPSILSSIPMFVEPFFLSPYSVNHVSGIADCLNGLGYETAFFHGAERGSMGFMAFARATKFQNYYGREDFVADSRTRGDKEYDGWWGISDEPFLQYFATKMSDMKEPFMTALFTLSSHHPYQVPEPYKDVFKEENPKMPVYKVIRYTDMALRHFFSTAKLQPWYENTLFVITSDHTNMWALQEYGNDLGGFCSPIIFYDPTGEMDSGMVDAIAQQTDIMPTILEYLGYDKPYLAFGIDLLSTPPEDTWAVNYLNGIYQYIKNGYVLQFDGQKTRAVFSLEDRLMQHNIVGSLPQQSQMERELKAIIQQYMERMTENRLVP